MRSVRKYRGHTEMSKIREILRLSCLGTNMSEISRVSGVTRATVREYTARFRASKLSHEESQHLSDHELILKLGIKKPGRRGLNISIDFQKVSQELLRKHVTKILLWEEYCERHEDNFYSYSQFCSKYKD